MIEVACRGSCEKVLWVESCSIRELNGMNLEARKLSYWISAPSAVASKNTVLGHLPKINYLEKYLQDGIIHTAQHIHNFVVVHMYFCTHRCLSLTDHPYSISRPIPLCSNSELSLFPKTMILQTK